MCKFSGQILPNNLKNKNFLEENEKISLCYNLNHHIIITIETIKI